MSNTLILLLATVGATYTAVLRLYELLVSKRNQTILGEQGFTRKDNGLSYLLMVSMHILFFVSLIIECFFLTTISSTFLQTFSLIIFFLSQILRFITMKTLGSYWNTNIMSSSQNCYFIDKGPYRYIRHPNYLAIVLEFISLPLCLGAWRTALLFTVLNAAVLTKRIKDEEIELFKIAGYQEIMGSKKRLFPGLL